MNAIAVAAPPQVLTETGLPKLALALDPTSARKQLKRRLPLLSGEGKLRLKEIRVIRHKPGRRCVVEYDAEVDRPDVASHTITLIGKTRVRRSGNEGFRVQKAIWEAGFQDNSVDGISVPEPIGVIPAFQMWFQRKVAGVTVDKLWMETEGIALARRIAEAANKLHRAGVPIDKAHGIEDELRILRVCLNQVAQRHPAWAQRLERLMDACERLAAGLPVPKVCGIHRDFYSSQVIIDGDRLWLIDFDLYCQGDPALDVGNFIGHITEQALREQGRADALLAIEQALEDRFLDLSEGVTRAAVRGYTNLTLVRHIFLSTNFPERRHLTEALLQLCEERLG